MRFLSEFLVIKDQVIITLENGKPCRHCRKRKVIPLSDHLVSWEIPKALIVYAGEDVGVVCLDCVRESVVAKKA